MNQCRVPDCNRVDRAWPFASEQRGYFGQSSQHLVPPEPWKVGDSMICTNFLLLKVRQPQFENSNSLHAHFQFPPELEEVNEKECFHNLSRTGAIGTLVSMLFAKGLPELLALSDHFTCTQQSETNVVETRYEHTIFRYQGQICIIA